MMVLTAIPLWLCLYFVWRPHAGFSPVEAVSVALMYTSLLYAVQAGARWGCSWKTENVLSSLARALALTSLPAGMAAILFAPVIGTGTMLCGIFVLAVWDYFAARKGILEKPLARLQLIAAGLYIIPLSMILVRIAQ